MFLKDLLQEYIFECEIKKFTWKTIKSYRNSNLYLINYLEQEFNITNAKEVMPTHIKQFMMFQIKKGCKESYLNGLLRAFRAFYKYLLQEGYITENPTLKINWAKESKTIIKTFTNEEVKKMMNTYSEIDYMSVRNKAILAMLFDTGIRNYELCILPCEAIKDNLIQIWGKGNKERQVGKSPYLCKMLMKYLRYREVYFSYKNINYNNLFLSRTGKPLTTEAIERIVLIAGKQANVSNSIRCSPHTCRHWFAQSQLKNGIDVYSLSRILGHSNIKITQRYLEGLQDDEVVIKSIKTSPLMNL